MKIVLAIDSFKGCLTADEAVAVAAQAWKHSRPGDEVVEMPVTDGGDGMMQVFSRVYGCTPISVPCHDALMRPIAATFALRADGLCILETAAACGLHLLGADELRPLRATTYGVGELMIAAIERGCRSMLIGLGGSATSDCGLGMLKAFRRHWGDDWLQVVRGQGLDLRLASDVDNPLFGPRGAAAVYGPQKGADRATIALLDRRAATFAIAAARKMGYDRSTQPGAGAAGGLGYAFMQFLDARVTSGADVLLRAVRFDELVAGAHLVVTGEGSADRQTLMGKIPQRILQRAARVGVPVHLLAGRVRDEAALLQAGFASVQSINPPDMSLEQALNPDVARHNLAGAVTVLAQGADARQGAEG